MKTNKHLRELAANLEKWRDTCADYETINKKAEETFNGTAIVLREDYHAKAEYHRGAKEAYDRALDRVRQLFQNELRTSSHAIGTKKRYERTPGEFFHD